MLNLSIIATPHDRESSVPHFYDLPFHQRQLFRNQRIICVDKYLKIHAALQKCRFLPFNGSVGLHIHIPKTPSISRIDLCRLHILFSPNSKLQKSLACQLSPTLKLQSQFSTFLSPINILASFRHTVYSSYSSLVDCGLHLVDGRFHFIIP